MKRSLTALLLVMLVALLVIAGCGSNTSSSSNSNASSGAPATATSTTSAKTTACKGVSGINQALTSLSNITVDTTVGDVKAAQAKITNAMATIQAQHPIDNQGLVGQVSAANDKLTEKIAGYPNQTPIGKTSDNVQDMKARVADAQTKTKKLGTELDCAATMTPTP
jgi:hypothetical protein